MVQDKITIVAAVNNRQVLEENLLQSPALRCSSFQLLIKEGFASASLAYNDAIADAENDLLIFLHQDIYLPERWFAKVQDSVQWLQRAGVKWGVLGCFGSRRNVDGGLGRVYTTGLGVHGNVILNPEPVETLDEIVLIIRKSSGLKFDQHLPHFHMYGVDLCLSASSKGFTNFAIPAFCIHNTDQITSLPREFWSCYWYVKRKWARLLPIHAACIKISHLDADLRERQLRDLIAHVLGRRPQPAKRHSDPQRLMGAILATMGANSLT